MGLLQKHVEVGEGAEEWIDVAEDGDVVAEVGHGRGVEGGNPDGVDAERDEVVEAGDDTGEVAYAVAVCVLKAARVDLVNDTGLPPLGCGEFAIGHTGIGCSDSGCKCKSFERKGREGSEGSQRGGGVALEDGYGVG